MTEYATNLPFAVKKLPPADLLRKYLRYDQETGGIYWLWVHQPERDRPWWYQPQAAGTRADRTPSYGYCTLNFDGARYSAHRVIWKMVHGHDPIWVIDHINGDRHDNRLANLRDVPMSVNAKNNKHGRWTSILTERRAKLIAAERKERVELSAERKEKRLNRYLALKEIFEPELLTPDQRTRLAAVKRSKQAKVTV